MSWRHAKMRRRLLTRCSPHRHRFRSRSCLVPSFALRLGMPVLSSAARKWLPYGFAWAHKSEDERELGRERMSEDTCRCVTLLMWVVFVYRQETNTFRNDILTFLLPLEHNLSFQRKAARKDTPSTVHSEWMRSCGAQSATHRFKENTAPTSCFRVTVAMTEEVGCRHFRARVRGS